MKKMIIVCSALLVVASCSKENNLDQRPPGQKKTLTHPYEYESFEPTGDGDIEAILIDFIEDFNNEEVQDMEPTEAIWTMEGAINISHSEENFVVDKVQTISLEGVRRVTLTSETELVEGSDIEAIVAFVAEVVDTNLGNEDRLIASDFYVSNIGEGTLDISVDLVIGRSVTIIYSEGDLPEATVGLKAGIAEDCLGDPAPPFSAMDQCEINAINRYRRKFGRMHMSFYSSVTKYKSSYPSGHPLLISDQGLLGHSNCVVAAHDISNQPLSKSTCVSTTQQNTYTSGILSDAMGKPGETVNINLDDDSFSGYYFWTYEAVTKGTPYEYHAGPVGPAISY